MKQKYILFLVFLSLCFWGKAQGLSERQYYYYNGEKVFLNVDYSCISIVSENEYTVGDTIQTSSAVFTVENSYTFNARAGVVSDEKYCSKPLSNKNAFIAEIKVSDNLPHQEYFNAIQTLQRREHVIKVSPSFLSLENNMNVSNNFYVKLFKGSDVEILYKMANQYSIRILGYNEFMPLWYTLSCTAETPFNAIEAANLFHESQLYESTEPEFLFHILPASEDPYFSDQWGLKNIGQHCNSSGIDIRAEEAWSITTGSPDIRIAIFDDGIKMDHPDLINNIYGTGYDVMNGASPSVLRGGHGTPCAGIIGAQQNNQIGISGVAPNSKLISISQDYNYVMSAQIANGFNWAWQNGAGIISCSWGGDTTNSHIVDDAIINALTLGRSGKGSVIVFASGNGNHADIKYPQNRHPELLVVGAISPNGERKSPTSCDGDLSWSGSNYGIHLVNPALYIPPVYHLMFGGMLLGAIFMATDMVTSPMSRWGQIIFGIGCGALTMIIRLWGAYPEGVSFAILIMNAFVPLINKGFEPKRFGEKIAVVK